MSAGQRADVKIKHGVWQGFLRKSGMTPVQPAFLAKSSGADFTSHSA
jgi:hypothetical protein